MNKVLPAILSLFGGFIIFFWVTSFLVQFSPIFMNGPWWQFPLFFTNVFVGAFSGITGGYYINRSVSRLFD